MKIIGGLIGLVLAIVGIAFLWDAASKKPDAMIEPAELSRSVRSLASAARETTLFAQQLAAGDLTAAFAKTHREKLEENVKDEVKKLDAPSPASIAKAATRAHELGEHLAALLKDLESKLADREALREIQDDTARTGAELARLAPAS